MAQYDEEYFKKQFEGLPPKATAAVALRAAMRVLPLLARPRNNDDEPFAYWKDGERSRNALTIFRCCEVSLFVNGLMKSDLDAAIVASMSPARATP